jgi:hypothetical protein
MYLLKVNMNGKSFINKYAAKGKQRQPKNESLHMKSWGPSPMVLQLAIHFSIPPKTISYPPAI